MKPKTNWLGWTRWRKLYSEMVVVCCDCGLGHKFQFKNNEGKIFWRAKRDKLSTKEARKKRGGDRPITHP
jgi:hypothetical protein